MIFKVQYSVNASNQKKTHGLALQWQAVNEGKSAVPSLFFASAMAMDLPMLMLRTMPNIFCASTSSTITGPVIVPRSAKCFYGKVG